MRGVRPKGSEPSKMKRRVLADVVAGVGVAAFDGGVGDRVEHLQAGHDLAGARRAASRTCRPSSRRRRVAIVAEAPHSVSRLLGKLDVRRHLTISLVCSRKRRGCGRDGRAGGGQPAKLSAGQRVRHCCFLPKFFRF